MTLERLIFFREMDDIDAGIHIMYEEKDGKVASNVSVNWHFNYLGYPDEKLDSALTVEYRGYKKILFENASFDFIQQEIFSIKKALVEIIKRFYENYEPNFRAKYTNRCGVLFDLEC